MYLVLKAIHIVSVVLFLGNIITGVSGGQSRRLRRSGRCF
jgi:hypothetical protein